MGTRYVNADNEIIQAVGSGAKTKRGLGEFYNTLTDSLESDPETFLEIGAGLLHSQMVWSKVFPHTRVVGLEVASSSVELCSKQNITVKQLENSLNGLELAATSPMHVMKNVVIHYNRDAYTEEVKSEFVETYGKLPIIVNDGRPTSWIHIKFQELWKDAIIPGGCLIQEKFGRHLYEGVMFWQLRKAILNGWLLYDVREMVEFDVNSTGIVGVWSNDPNKYLELFKDFKRITDVDKQLPAYLDCN